MLAKRIIPCLDVKGGRVVKGVKFENLRDVGDPAELATRYMDEGADEVVFLDISASREERMVERLMPEPEPPLKIMPSVRHQSRIDSMSSSTERMKQAEHWGFSLTPTLNQTGLLKQASWSMSM